MPVDLKEERAAPEWTYLKGEMDLILKGESRAAVDLNEERAAPQWT